MLRREWRSQGYTPRECDLLWQEQLELGYALQVCEKQGFKPEQTAKQIAAFKARLRSQRRDKGFLVRT